MSLPEIGFRIRSKIFAKLQSYGAFTAERVPEPDLKGQSDEFVKKSDAYSELALLEAADAARDGRLELFAGMSLVHDSSPNWNADPLSGKVALLTFGKDLDYRDPGLVGDIKYLWEPNRHLHLVTLAQAYRLTDDPKYLHGMKLQLESSLDQCPYLMGPNWTSSLELAIRLINWGLTWQLLGGLESSPFREAEHFDFRTRWLESIYRCAGAEACPTALCSLLPKTCS